MRTIEIQNQGLRQARFIVRILRFFAAAQNDGFWLCVILSDSEGSLVTRAEFRLRLGPRDNTNRARVTKILRSHPHRVRLVVSRVLSPEDYVHFG